MVTTIGYAPEIAGVKEYTASSPGVLQGPPRPFQAPPPLKEKLADDPQEAIGVIELQGSLTGVAQVTEIVPELVVVFSSSIKK